jgi:hypothetical protein
MAQRRGAGLSSGSKSTREVRMRKSMLVAIACCMASGGALAQSARPNLYTMSCSSAAAFINARGAIVANTSPTTYERLVASEGFCLRNEQAYPYFSPTRDRAQCMVGYQCLDKQEWEQDR